MNIHRLLNSAAAGLGVILECECGCAPCPGFNSWSATGGLVRHAGMFGANAAGSGGPGESLYSAQHRRLMQKNKRRGARWEREGGIIFLVLFTKLLFQPELNGLFKMKSTGI